MSREMKHSGIDWIGEIPKEWEVVRLKNLGEFQNGLTYSPIDMCDENGVLVIRSSNIKDSKLVFDDNVFVNDAPSSLMVQKGDIIICSRNGSADLVGKCAMVENNLNASFGAFMVRFRSVIDNYFSFYLIQTAIPQYKVLFTTTTINQLTKSMLSTMIGVLPSISEQQKIANYLDKVCGEVDEMIALQEQMIEELKAYKQSVITEAVTKGLNPNVPMKNSGIDWIGEVPEHWKSERLKFLCTIQTGNQDTQDSQQDGEYPFYVRSPKVERSTKYSFDGEGILMAGDGAGAGRVFHHAFGKYAVHQRVYRLSDFSNKIDTTYLYHYVGCLFCKVMDMGSAQSTVPSVRLPMLLNFVVCKPPISEQQSIASYLDIKCSEIDALIAIKQTKIEELKEYKKSVIYEYVTGKKEVI